MKGSMDHTWKHPDFSSSHLSTTNSMPPMQSSGTSEGSPKCSSPYLHLRPQMSLPHGITLYSRVFLVMKRIENCHPVAYTGWWKGSNLLTVFPWSFQSYYSELSSRLDTTLYSSPIISYSVIQTPFLLWYYTRRKRRIKKAHGTERKLGRWENTWNTGDGEMTSCLSPLSRLEKDTFPLPSFIPQPSHTQKWHWCSYVMKMWPYCCLLLHFQTFSLYSAIMLI